MNDTFDQAPDPRIGQQIASKYRIERVLGQGGMGRVYVATHLGLNASVALKFLLDEHTSVASLQERFRREASALSMVRHPGVVSILDFGEHEGRAYMAMEYVPGRPLSDLLGKEHPPLPLHQIGDIYKQLLDVLVAAHDKGVVHRDLKPDNVLLTGGNDQPVHVKVLDFGLAAFVHRGQASNAKLTEVGVVHGTPTYMSPEQCRGVDVGPETDVYAWGAMLFFALAGVPPFDSADMTTMMTQHLFVEPPAIADVGYMRHVSAGMERVVRDALCKRADQRPSAIQIRDRFAAALAGTDPDAMQRRAADERQTAAGLSRNDRALTGIAPPPDEFRSLPAPNTAESLSYPRVVLWGTRDDPESLAMQTALSVAGMRVTPWNKETPPPDELHGDVVQLVVLHASRGTDALTHKFTAPVLVLGVAHAADTASWIRAGASDLVLHSGDVDSAVRKARTVLRRKR